MVAEALKAFVKSGRFPSVMVVSGGSKAATNTARAVIRDYYVNAGLFQHNATFCDIRIGSHVTPGHEELLPLVLVIDASVAPHIVMIRDFTRIFLKTPASSNLKKFILVEETNRLSYYKQRSIASLAEAYPNTVLIYTTAELSKIDPSIRSGHTATFEINQ